MSGNKIKHIGVISFFLISLLLLIFFSFVSVKICIYSDQCDNSPNNIDIKNNYSISYRLDINNSKIADFDIIYTFNSTGLNIQSNFTPNYESTRYDHDFIDYAINRAFLDIFEVSAVFTNIESELPHISDSDTYDLVVTDNYIRLWYHYDNEFIVTTWDGETKLILDTHAVSIYFSSYFKIDFYNTTNLEVVF